MRSTLYARYGKRALDVAAASGGLAVLLPVAALVAAAVRLDSKGPVFFRQERIGREGRAFRLWKFRSMVPGAQTQGAGILLERNDPRVTRVGRVIRRLGLDEIPQLLNVISGDMSMVGPRPTLRYQVELYDERQRGRLAVRPGITGWAQVHGRKGLDWARRIELDLEYVERISLARDLVILLRTIPAVLLEGEGAPAGDYWKEKARERGGSPDTLGSARPAPRRGDREASARGE